MPVINTFRFTDADWNAYNGAARLPDGSEPFVGYASVEGRTDTATIFFAGAERWPTGDARPIDVAVEIYTVEGDPVEIWTKQVPSLSHANRLLGFLTDPISLDDLSLLSFSRRL